MTVRLLVSALVLSGVLSGCSAGEDAYCAAVKDHQPELADIVDTGTPQGVLALLPPFGEIADNAPWDINDEWQQVLTPIRAMQEVVDETGIDPATYDPDNPPTDLDDEQLQRIAEAADGLAAPETGAAMDAIEQQVRDVCHTPLGL